MVVKAPTVVVVVFLQYNTYLTLVEFFLGCIWTGLHVVAVVAIVAVAVLPMMAVSVAVFYQLSCFVVALGWVVAIAWSLKYILFAWIYKELNLDLKRLILFFKTKPSYSPLLLQVK